MKPISWLLPISMLLMVSCSSTRLIQHTDEAYREINQELDERKVTLEQIDGYEFTGLYNGIDLDSICIGVDKIAVKNAKVIKIKNHNKGYYAGYGIGLLSGLMIGYVIGASTSTDRMGAGWWALGGAGVGCLVGGFIGGISGISDYYFFAPSKKEDGKPKDKITVDKNHIQTQEVRNYDKSPIRVEFSSIKIGSGYINILWQGKEIHLLRSEYNYRGTTEDGRQYIVVPKYIYESKFK